MDRLKSQMAARDESDATRTVAPLQMAADAVYVDTTGLDAQQVFERVLRLVHERSRVPSIDD